jgi:hypothetical protein
MSFENYKVNNFSYNQALSYQDLNNLTTNDAILYNKINTMPRGILAFSEHRTTSFSNFFSIKQSSTDPDIVDGYKMLQAPTASGRKDWSLEFTVEDFRLIRFNFYSSHFSNNAGSSVPSATAPGHFKAAFFITENGGSSYMLNANYKTTAITSNIAHGSLSMNYIANLPAGTHSVRVGVKHYKAGIRIGYRGSQTQADEIIAQRRPAQMYVEDIGSFIAQGSEVEREF